MTPAVKVDRAALVRRALVELVAENGFRGSSMAAVAQRAGVATGTAYVHYASKDDLVLAAYLEAKAALGAVTLEAIDPGAEPAEQFRAAWRAVHAHLAADPVQARFLVQVQASPYAASAHDAAMAQEDLLATSELREMVSRFVDLPPLVLYDLGLGPAIRVAATETKLTRRQRATLAAACWRAVSKG